MPPEKPLSPGLLSPESGIVGLSIQPSGMPSELCGVPDFVSGPHRTRTAISPRPTKASPDFKDLETISGLILGVWYLSIIVLATQPAAACFLKYVVRKRSRLSAPNLRIGRSKATANFLIFRWHSPG